MTDVNFRYSDDQDILSNINLVINKGSRIGIIGRTGSGKSTLLDIIMGLLVPKNGKLTIDGVLVNHSNNSSWQKNIASVPQRIFLADVSILENIAFGVPYSQIDHDRVIEAAEEAQIAKDIDLWPERYETIVGERGVRLSGGQAQRIGIARALYKKANFIVFDEATSALDNKTEETLMRSIESNDKDQKTFIIVAHRLTTLKGCDQIVELEDGRIKRVGTYQEII